MAVVFAVAVLAGMLVAFQPSFPPKSKSYDVGTATAQVLVDTPQSQIAGDSSSTSAGGAQTLGTLGVQAELLAGLMVEGPIKADIAHRAGLKSSQLIGVSSAVTVPSAAGSASGPTSPAVPSGPDVFALTTQILTDTTGQTNLPIIDIQAQAPDTAKAVKLANAAVAGLQAFVSSEAATERIPDADRLSIMSLGLSDVATQTSGPSPMTGILVTFVVLLVGCALMLWVRNLIRSWRGAAERERLGLPDPVADGAGWAAHESAPASIGARRTLVGGQRLVRPHVSTNGSSVKPDHGSLTFAPDDASLPTEDTSAQGSALPRQWSSRQWSSRRS